ncbi:tail protein X [Pseudomonas sp. HK3]
MTQQTIKYRSVQGETISSICYRYYGKTKGIVEQVLEVNSTLAEHGPILPIGTIVELPPLNNTVVVNKAVLWI